ncbi:MAG: MmcQ/YjbR family DNA-binding protein [Flavobacteriales bacterium]|nr:MmcQ/YjbR family DNA-binding protein [Flavobacteriales bacterium]
MNIEYYRQYCLAKKGTSEEFPFDNRTLVFKVGGKMFALTDVESFESINLKCDPERAIELREQYSAIIPGYHMNKKHWNTLVLDGSLRDSLICSLIDDSYLLVAGSLPKKDREKLGIL